MGSDGSGNEHCSPAADAGQQRRGTACSAARQDHHHHHDAKTTPLDFGKKLLSGGTAGVVAKTCIAPLERVKILFQVANMHYPYTGVVSTLQRIVQREGFLALYKGNASSILRVFPYAAIQFATFDMFKRWYTPEGMSISPAANFFAGASAGAVAVMFTYPLDVTRARLAVQVEQHQYKGALHGIMTMWRHEGGMRALWRGIQPTILGILPYAGTNFLVYDTLKWYYIHKWSSSSSSSNDIPTSLRVVFGAMAGLTGQTITYPLDVVRRRMQIDGLKLERTYSYAYTSTWDGLRRIALQEGPSALFRGLHINYIKVVPLVSVSFTLNDLLRRWMGLNTAGGVSKD